MSVPPHGAWRAVRTTAGAWTLAAILLATASGTPAHGFNVDTARTMMAFSDAVTDEPNTAIDRMRAMGASETSFSDGGSYAAFNSGLFDPGSQVTVSKMFRNGRTIFVVAIRGTEPRDPRDLATDLNFKYTPLSPELPGVKVHTGFLKTSNLAIQALRPYLKQIRNDPNSEVIFTGHSLGGAAATIAAAQLTDLGVPRAKVSAYAFGAPAVGNADFERRYRDLKVWRVNQPNDPVPKVLDNTIMGFRHIGRQGILENGQITFAPPRRPGLFGRFISGIRTFLGLFGLGRERNLDLNAHRRPGYTAQLAGAGVNGLTPDLVAGSTSIVTQPAAAVTPISGTLPTV